MTQPFSTSDYTGGDLGFFKISGLFKTDIYLMSPYRNQRKQVSLTAYC